MLHCLYERCHSGRSDVCRHNQNKTRKVCPRRTGEGIFVLIFFVNVSAHAFVDTHNGRRRNVILLGADTESGLGCGLCGRQVGDVEPPMNLPCMLKYTVGIAETTREWRSQSQCESEGRLWRDCSTTMTASAIEDGHRTGLWWVGSVESLSEGGCGGIFFHPTTPAGARHWW